MMVMSQVLAPMPPPQIPFDPNFLTSQIMNSLEGLITAVAVVFVARWFFRSPIAEAIAEGIRLRRRRRWGTAGELTGESESHVAALEERVGVLSEQVSELGERLDFAERMLAGRGERRLGAGQ